MTLKIERRGKEKLYVSRGFSVFANPCEVKCIREGSRFSRTLVKLTFSPQFH